MCYNRHNVDGEISTVDIVTGVSNSQTSQYRLFLSTKLFLPKSMTGGIHGV